jgi:alcohol/geraniol dehydrogenase (NADP+)
MNHKAWVAKAAKQSMALESVDLGPLGAEDVEVAVEHCGVCHSDLSVLNNEWGISQYPAILGHEVVGRITAVGPNTKEPRSDSKSGWAGTRAAACTATSACPEATISVRKCNRRLSVIAAGSQPAFVHTGLGRSRCRRS